jgi:hypothetical protein
MYREKEPQFLIATTTDGTDAPTQQGDAAADHGPVSPPSNAALQWDGILSEQMRKVQFSFTLLPGQGSWKLTRSILIDRGSYKCTEIFS